MSTTLFVSLFAFVFLSAELATSLGIGTYRIYAFSSIVALLVVVSIVTHPYMSGRHLRNLCVMGCLLLVLIVAHAGQPFSPVDFKFLLPLLIMIAATNIAARLKHLDLPVMVWWMLSSYIAIASYPLLTGGGSAITGYDEYRRYDSTGSVITLASMATMLVLITPTMARATARPFFRHSIWLVGLWALLLLFMTATRTALATVAIAWIISVVAGPNRQASLKIGTLGLLAFAGLFALYSLAISDAFLLRLAGSGDATDWTSGRFHSLEHWLWLTSDHPFGRGIGYVRGLMGDGRPVLDDGALLEWPHNEFVRFYVEGGVIGLMLIVMVVATLVQEGLRAIPRCPDPRYAALITALVADILAQSTLQNYFNSIYHATVMITVLLIACVNGCQRFTVRTGYVVPRMGPQAPDAATHGIEGDRHGAATGFIGKQSV